MKKSFIIFALFLPATAHAAACAAGKYLSGGACVTCDIGYYCPGDDKRHYCTEITNASYADEPGMTTCKKCPTVDAAHQNGFRDYGYWEDGGSSVHTRIDSCRANWSRTPHEHETGSNIFGCYYSSKHNGYVGTDTDISYKCTIVDITCDAGYIFDVENNPNVSDAIATEVWTYGYDFMQYDLCTPAPVGKYSPAETGLATDCPAGTSTHRVGATSAAACEPLCGGGATKLHAGELSFNMWPNGECASPALRIKNGGDVCCVNLESGVANGAVNVRWGGATYHTVN